MDATPDPVNIGPALFQGKNTIKQSQIDSTTDPALGDNLFPHRSVFNRILVLLLDPGICLTPGPWNLSYS